ncbi:MAG: IS1 family transposase, partial [Bacteroidales bacterium]
MKKNGYKYDGKQNYYYNDFKRQFIGDYNLNNKGCHSQIKKEIELMVVRGIGIRDISEIEGV